MTVDTQVEREGGEMVGIGWGVWCAHFSERL